MEIQSKLVSMAEALDHIKDGHRIMVGGFAGTANPLHVLRKVVEKGVKDLTLICNDTGTDENDVGMLIMSKSVSKAIVSHIGKNAETCRQYAAGEIEVEFVPQGTLIERIRSAGFGLGGCLTPTGIGTSIAEGKQVLNIDGKDYLLELPLAADIAIIRARKADKIGNLCYHGTNTSHGMMMATAAAITIVQADEIVEVGDIEPDAIDTPSVFVDYIVKGDASNV